MINRLLPLLRSAMYALRGGFLVRPLLISIALGLLGAMLSSLEESVLQLSAWVPAFLFLFPVPIPRSPRSSSARSPARS